MTRLTWGEILPMWWSFIWRATLYGMLMGFALGAIGGFIAAMSNSPASAQTYGTVGGLLAGLPASLLALKQTISRHGAAIASIHRTIQRA